MLDIKVTLQRSTSREVERCIPFEKIATRILGARYELSLVICGDTLAQRINKEHRAKSYRPNVLSFPIDTHEGEIFLNLRCAEREAHSMNISITKRVALLFVHGCFHLKGLDHSLLMEQKEHTVLKRFMLI